MAGVNPVDYSKSFMASARQHLEACETLQQKPAVVAAASGEASSGTSSSNGAAAGEAEAGPALAAPAAAAAAAAAPAAPAQPRTAVEALDVAHRATQLPGSATACLLRLDAARGLLDAANLGDSGFLIIRGGRLHFQSPAMQHYFDCPLQVRSRVCAVRTRHRQGL